MTEYKMTDEMRKKLTEDLLEECWHCYVINEDELSKCSCGITGFDVREICVNGNRTFTTDTDMLAVFRKIRDGGKWNKFYRYAGKYWLKDDDAWVSEKPFEEWLFLDNPERVLCIVSMWLEEQK